MTTETLKPCPFCSSTKATFTWRETAGTVVVECLGCGVRTNSGETEAEAAEAWNLRRSAASAEPAVELAWQWTAAGDSKPWMRLSNMFTEVGGDIVAVRPLYAAPPPSPVVSEAMVQRGINALNDAMASHPPTIVTKDGVAIIHPQTAAAAMRAALTAALSPAPAGEAMPSRERLREKIADDPDLETEAGYMQSNAAAVPTSELRRIARRAYELWRDTSEIETVPSPDILVGNIEAAIRGYVESPAPAGEVGWREAFDELLAALTRCLGIIEEYQDENVDDPDWLLMAKVVSDDARTVIAKAQAIPPSPTGRRQAMSTTEWLQPMDTFVKGDGIYVTNAYIHEGCVVVFHGTNDKPFGWMDAHAFFKDKVYRHHLLAASPSPASPADDVAGLIAQSRKSAILLRAMATNYANGHSVDSLDIAAFQCAANNQDDLAAALSRLQAEADKWKARWQSKADAFEVQEQSIAVLQARLAEVDRELDFERGERRRVSDLCDETEHERAVADASAATMREALTEANRVLEQTPDRLRSNAHKNAIGKSRAALGGQHG
jgi:Lar family restriction alleviation protein